MIGPSVLFIAFVLSRSRTASANNAGRDADSLHFAGRRQLDEPEYRTHRRPQTSGDGSYVENLFEIPIAVIKGTAAAVQTFSPQNTEAIDKVFDIPVSTLDAVGNFIRESRPQRVSNDNNGETVEAPTRRVDRRRDERRERITRIREEELTRRRLVEQERQRRRIEEREKLLQQGNNRTFNLASGLIGLLVGNGGGGFFGTQSHGHGHGHGHGQHGLLGRPPHRPPKPSRPFKPGSHGGQAGSHGNFQSGNGAYQVNEEINEKPVHSSGIFSWLHTSQADDRIQNKIAPGAEYLDDREPAEFRFS